MTDWAREAATLLSSFVGLRKPSVTMAAPPWSLSVAQTVALIEEKLAAAAKAREAEIDAELASLADDKSKLSTVTMDEVFEKDPALKEEVDQRIRDGKWF